MSKSSILPECSLVSSCKVNSPLIGFGNGWFSGYSINGKESFTTGQTLIGVSFRSEFKKAKFVFNKYGKE